LLRVACWPGNALAIEREILRMTTQHARHDVLLDWVLLRKRYPVSTGNALRQLWAAARFDAGAAAPDMPVLVLGGQGDRLVSVQCSVALAKQWGCALRLHASAGHDLPLDDGPWVAAQVREWLLKYSPPTP
jgi:pimeloyl-ACP methyl ester carboxylesterase